MQSKLKKNKLKVSVGLIVIVLKCFVEREMKTAYLFLGAFLSAFILLGLINYNPDKPAYQSSKKVEFKLIKTFGAESEPREALLSWVNNLQFDNKNNLYLLEVERLLSFDQCGKLRWSVNKNGRGPGDIYNPWGLAVDGEKYLYIGNVTNARIDKFNLNGKYIVTLKVGSNQMYPLRLIGYIKPDLLIATRCLQAKVAEDISIMKIGTDIQLKNHFLVDETDDVKLHPGQSVGLGGRVIGDKIAVGNCYKYKLNIYDINGKVLKTLKKNFSRLPKPVVSSPYRFGVYGGVSAPYIIIKSIIW